MIDPASPLPAPFFWLHIKKCGGGSIRRLLSPWYAGADRVHRPVNFIQSDPAYYNDILNNFRIPLGAYQFRRALFAKTFLYPQNWDDMLRFAFTRNPVDRAVSAFHYLSHPRGVERSFVQHLTETGQKIPDDMTHLFDLFLDLVAEARQARSSYIPVNLHFTTHTAPVWDDVSDDDGQILLSHIYRLEALKPALNQVFERCGLDRRLDETGPPVNALTGQERHQPTRQQRSRLEALYPRDFELYETALAPAA